MEVTFKQLTTQHMTILQQLMEKCSDYLIFQDEEPVKPSAAQALFSAKPAGVTEDAKVVLGIFTEKDQLIGVFDLIKGYSGPRILSLGLLLLDPSNRGKGIGEKAYKLLEEWAINHQFNRIRLGVLIGNEKGMRFWKRMDYIETGEIKTQMRPNLSKKVKVLEKIIIIDTSY